MYTNVSENSNNVQNRKPTKVYSQLLSIQLCN